MKNDNNTSRLRSRQKCADVQDAFFATLRAYARLGELSTVAAIVNDDEAPKNNTLGPGSLSLDFKVDLERLTTKTLEGDKPAQQAWFALLAGETVEPALAKDVIRRCGEAYIEAGLPTYFVPKIRRGRGESRATA